MGIAAGHPASRMSGMDIRNAKRARTEHSTFDPGPFVAEMGGISFTYVVMLHSRSKMSGHPPSHRRRTATVSYTNGRCFSVIHIERSINVLFSFSGSTLPPPRKGWPRRRASPTHSRTWAFRCRGRSRCRGSIGGASVSGAEVSDSEGSVGVPVSGSAVSESAGSAGVVSSSESAEVSAFTASRTAVLEPAELDILQHGVVLHEILGVEVHAAEADAHVAVHGGGDLVHAEVEAEIEGVGLVVQPELVGAGAVWMGDEGFALLGLGIPARVVEGGAIGFSNVSSKVSGKATLSLRMAALSTESSPSSVSSSPM